MSESRETTMKSRMRQTMQTSDDWSLLQRWIRPEPDQPGDPNARIAESGIPVWALIGNYKANGRHASMTATDYGLPVEAVKAALAYYRAHREIIEARLAANDAAAV
jgi:uncharacterized protein (DUF433 family)